MRFFDEYMIGVVVIGALFAVTLVSVLNTSTASQAPVVTEMCYQGVMYLKNPKGGMSVKLTKESRVQAC